MDTLKWLRPRQISMKSSLVGFTQINKDGVLETEIDNLVGMETADFRRISYGDILENRWFLNAASLVAQEQRQLNLVTCSQEPSLVSCRKQGLYVFRFFKSEDPYFVIIDDRLPTIELQSG